MKDGDKQPFSRLRLELRGDRSEVLPTGFLQWLDQANAGITSAQWPSHLALKFVHRLNGVPTRCPEKRNQRRRCRFRTGLHRESKGGVGIVRRLGFVHADVGDHRSAAAIPVRFASDLANSAARRRDRWNSSECWYLRGHRRDEVVKSPPLCLVVEPRGHGAFTQPSLTLLHIDAGVENLKESL